MASAWRSRCGPTTGPSCSLAGTADDLADSKPPAALAAGPGWSGRPCGTRLGAARRAGRTQGLAHLAQQRQTDPRACLCPGPAARPGANRCHRVPDPRPHMIAAPDGPTASRWRSPAARSAVTGRSSTAARRHRWPPAWEAATCPASPPRAARPTARSAAITPSSWRNRSSDRRSVHPVLGRPDREPGTLAEQEPSHVGSAQAFDSGLAAACQRALRQEQPGCSLVADHRRRRQPTALEQITPIAGQQILQGEREQPPAVAGRHRSSASTRTAGPVSWPSAPGPARRPGEHRRNPGPGPRSGPPRRSRHPTSTGSAGPSAPHG